MLIREDAANADEDEEGEHEKVDKDAVRLLLDVSWEDDGVKEESGCHQHDVARREGWFAGTVGASV